MAQSNPPERENLSSEQFGPHQPGWEQRLLGEIRDSPTTAEPDEGEELPRVAGPTTEVYLSAYSETTGEVINTLTLRLDYEIGTEEINHLASLTLTARR